MFPDVENGTGAGVNAGQKDSDCVEARKTLIAWRLQGAVGGSCELTQRSGPLGGFATQPSQGSGTSGKFFTPRVPVGKTWELP